LQSSDCHCFELSAVRLLMHDLAQNLEWKASDDVHVFLPSPVTWLEWSGGPIDDPTELKFNSKKKKVAAEVDHNATFAEMGRLVDAAAHAGNAVYHPRMAPNSDMNDELPPRRVGVLLMQSEPEYVRMVPWFWNADGSVSYHESNYFVRPEPNRLQMLFRQGMDDAEKGWMWWLCRRTMAAVALINTPRVIGRQQHMPHAGLQRALARSKGMVGKFPLRAWTEIKLEVRPPVHAEGFHEARLSGTRALHFCRAHLRVRRGQIEYVTHHWRGDASIGIKRSRYAMVPEKKQSNRAAARR
jgi:hypothetical protein